MNIANFEFCPQIWNSQIRDKTPAKSQEAIAPSFAELCAVRFTGFESGDVKNQLQQSLLARISAGV
jgi:hypothetical protein